MRVDTADGVAVRATSPFIGRVVRTGATCAGHEMDINDKPRNTWNKRGVLRHLGAPSWLTESTLQMLMSAFEDAGFVIYAAGGCVRDTIIAHHAVSVALSTNARPDQAVEVIESLLFRGKPWRAIQTHMDLGTVTAALPGAPQGYDVTTFWSDLETKGGHRRVIFSDEIEADAYRRDFTINAFYADKEGRVKDVVGGSIDLAARRIRFIGDPIQSIEKDPLRILGFFRSTAAYGARNQGADEDGLAACTLLSGSLADVPKDRIGAVMGKLVMEYDVAPIVRLMEETGVLTQILPGAASATLARLIALEERYPIEGRMLPPSSLATRLAALGADDVRHSLRLTADVASQIDLVTTEAKASTSPQELASKYGGWIGVQCLLLRWALRKQPFDDAAIARLWQEAS